MLSPVNLLLAVQALSFVSTPSLSPELLLLGAE